MGTFHVECRIENILNRSKSVVLQKAMVDTGSEATWVPADLLKRININREKKDRNDVR